jgi:hypothetical protein
VTQNHLHRQPSLETFHDNNKLTWTINLLDVVSAEAVLVRTAKEEATSRVEADANKIIIFVVVEIIYDAS